MAVKSKQDLIDYSLRALGAPVLEVNVDDDQISDRVDEALEYWRLYHHEGVEKIYLKHKITASRINLSSGDGSAFAYRSKVTGQTSGATATVVQEIGTDPAAGFITVRDVTGTFQAGETISNGTVSAVLSSVVLGDIDNRYVVVEDFIYGISRVLPLSQSSTSQSMFDLQYQLRLNDLYDLTSTSIIYYKQVQSYMALLDMELAGKPLFRFNRLQNRLHIDVNWNADLHPGNYIVVECYRALDPAEFSAVWREPWLKHYTTALIKRQWAVNLKKFQGLQLPGGVTMDGQGMYQEAMQEIKELEDELVYKSAPLTFFMG